MSDVADVKKPILKSLAAKMRRLEERIEDLIELRAAIERNGGKPGVPWEQVKQSWTLAECRASDFADFAKKRS
jgi:hypothetical protein